MITHYHREACEYNTLYKQMTDATHLLIAGTTGAGKSVLMNALISTKLKLFTPADVHFMFIDPKGVDMKKYVGVSDFCQRYEREPSGALSVLNEAISIMQSRYKALDRDPYADSFNGKDIIVVIDELADLIDSPHSKQIVDAMKRILRLGRAAKVHVWAATQDPSRKTIPAQLVQNFTDRIALRCLSAIESRQIIGIGGAENLPQYGECYYLNPVDGIKRWQLEYVPTEEVKQIIDYWKENPGVVEYEPGDRGYRRQPRNKREKRKLDRKERQQKMMDEYLASPPKYTTFCDYDSYGDDCNTDSAIISVFEMADGIFSVSKGAF